MEWHNHMALDHITYYCIIGAYDSCCTTKSIHAWKVKKRERSTVEKVTLLLNFYSCQPYTYVMQWHNHLALHHITCYCIIAAWLMRMSMHEKLSRQRTTDKKVYLALLSAGPKLCHNSNKKCKLCNLHFSVVPDIKYSKLSTSTARERFPSMTFMTFVRFILRTAFRLVSFRIIVNRKITRPSLNAGPFLCDRFFFPTKKTKWKKLRKRQQLHPPAFRHPRDPNSEHLRAQGVYPYPGERYHGKFYTSPHTFTLYSDLNPYR